MLWIAREYQKQGIKYVEIADTNLTKKGEPAIKLLEDVHEIMPKIEEETGVKIRFLFAIRRIPLTIIKDQKTSGNYLRENLDVMKAVAKSPYVVGSDFIGEEINDISELQPAISEIVRYVVEEDNGFTIRIHAGENDSLRDNVEKSIDCIKSSLNPGEKMPKFRLGHGLYTADLKTSEGKNLIKKMQETGAILEFQLTSNVRLNNLSDLSKHPLKTYLQNNIKCIQGTDGCGFYGTDTIDEQLALQNLLNLTDADFQKMREVEDCLINDSDTYFKEKSKKFEEFLNGRSLREAILEEELLNEEKSKDKNMDLRIRKGVFAKELLKTKIKELPTNKSLREAILEEELLNEEKSKDKNMDLRIRKGVFAKELLKTKIKELPTNKVPIIIAGGSFNGQNRETLLTEEGQKMLEDLIKKINNEKAYFVIGHKMEGFEKALVDISKKLNKKFEIDAIVPKMISEENGQKLINENIDKIRISTENEDSGIYKSFNYEIFERRNSVVVAFDGNSPVSNLVQEAKNGKGKSKIYVNEQNTSLYEKAKSLRRNSVVVAFDGNSPVSNLVQEAKNGKGKSKIYVNEQNTSLYEKAKSLTGYVVPFNMNDNIVDRILQENPEIAE